MLQTLKVHETNMFSLSATTELGAYLAGQGVDVVYGGGNYGVMGKMAEGVLQNGGKLTGYIPKFFTGISNS